MSMETLEDRIERLEFYSRLTLQTVDYTQFPFFTLVMSNKLTEQEVNEVLTLCDELQKKYEQQKEEGLVNFVPLLIHFAGMLTPKLKPKETIQAIKGQGLYPNLMEKLYEIASRYE
ncbi:DUF1878 family protein [Fictibacillus sp. Mic-4]|uniref:DUF1878 family protein n=1 Tax=Fictibacillus TaxID=1329200 RepID=UPI0003FE6CCA|nr:DUF1878 family protein [Fictibacillus gelatini]